MLRIKSQRRLEEGSSFDEEAIDTLAAKSLPTYSLTKRTFRANIGKLKYRYSGAQFGSSNYTAKRLTFGSI